MKMHTYLHQARPDIAKSFRDTNGSQIEKHFKHYEHGSIHALVLEKKILSCSNLNYLSTPESFIFLSPTPLWVQKEGN